jgi:TPR repeat protein
MFFSVPMVLYPLASGLDYICGHRPALSSGMLFSLWSGLSWKLLSSFGHLTGGAGAGFFFPGSVSLVPPPFLGQSFLWFFSETPEAVLWVSGALVFAMSCFVFAVSGRKWRNSKAEAIHGAALIFFCSLLAACLLGIGLVRAASNGPNYLATAASYYFSITSFILSILAGFCLYRLFAGIGSPRARRFAETAAAVVLAVMLALNFFRIQKTVRPMREPGESFFSLVRSGQRVLEVQKNWRLCPFGLYCEGFPSNAGMFFHLLDGLYGGQNRTEPVFLAQDQDGTCFLSGYVPWKGQRLSPEDFDMDGGGFSFAEGGFSPVGPGRRLLLTRTGVSPCDFAVTVAHAGHAGLILGYGPGRFVELGVSGNRLYGNVVKDNKSWPLFPDQLVKPVFPCRFEARRSGDTLHFFVNGTIWVPITAGPFFEGRVGFFAEDGTAGQKFYDTEMNTAFADQSVSRILRQRACLGRLDETALLSAFRTRAENGSVGAAYLMGLFRFMGSGVARDYAEAFRWWKLAADRGYAEAQNKVGSCFFTGQGVPRDYAQAAEWWKKAVEQGIEDAEYNLGLCYFAGQGVSRDLAQAARLFRKAADQGNADAEYKLGICCFTGQGVPRDFAQAAKWWEKAAEQGHSEAQRNLGYCCAKGKGVPRDFAQAIKWWEKAAKLGNSEAQNALGLCCYKGLGVPKDFIRAYMWFNLSSNQGNEAAAKLLDRLGREMPPVQISEARSLAQGWTPETEAERPR